MAVADQIKSSGKDRATRERHALAMARILQPERLPKGAPAAGPALPRSIRSPCACPGALPGMLGRSLLSALICSVKPR